LPQGEGAASRSHGDKVNYLIRRVRGAWSGSPLRLGPLA
jgi:hypothetical protein